MKLLKWKNDPKSLFRIYITGSLTILLLSLIVTAVVLSLGFAAQEKQRSLITLEHITKSIEFQYRALAEEMWTQSYEAIAIRVREVAQQQNSPSYNLKLYDSDGNCVYAEFNRGVRTTCDDRASDHRLIAKLWPHLSNGKKIEANESAEKYEIALALMVGKTFKGFLTCSFVDPYTIFRGNLFALFTVYLLPALVGLFLVWLSWLYLSNRFLLTPYLNSMLDSKKREALGMLATQVAHDIRSPLTALTMASRSLNENPAEKRLLIEKAAFRINEIANDLLGQYRRSTSNESRLTVGDKPLQLSRKVVLISTVLEDIFQEKLIAFNDLSRVTLSLDLTGPIDAECLVDRTQLLRALSNLLNNAVESIIDQGVVTIALRSSMKDVAIVISDNGKGMPEEIVKKLGLHPLTFAKTGSVIGSGLGFYHAKAIIESMDGQIFLQSKEGLGTIVTIRIPKV